MNLLNHIRREFAYDEWANRETLTAMQNGGCDQRSLDLLAHILSAERLWIERLKQEPQSFPVWPKVTLEICAKQVTELGQLWREYLEQTREDDLSRSIPYKNSKGEIWTSSIGDVLNHVVLHSAYHRGQIASHMRETGRTPAYTDFIHCIRQGLVT